MNEVGFLSEVLKSKEETLVVDIKETIPSITSNIERLKSDIKSFITDTDRFQSHVNIPNNYMSTLNVLTSEMEVLDEKISTASKQEIFNIKILEYELKKTRYSLHIASLFVNFHEKYKELAKVAKGKEYVDMVKKLTEVMDIVNAIPLEDNLDIVEEIVDDCATKQNYIVMKLMNVWDEAVKLDFKKEKNIETVTISIDNDTHDLKKIMEAMFYINSISQFDCLAEFLLNKILLPLINNTVTIKVSNKGSYENFDMKIRVNSPKMHYDLLFDNLATIFDYLCCKIDYTLDNNLTLIGYIGNRIRDKFCSVLIKNYLEELVPCTEEEFVNYKKVATRLESVNEHWKNIGFFDEESSNLLLKAGNVEIVYADKVSRNYLSKAMDIFKKDLHDMVQVGLDSNQIEENLKYNNFAKCYVSVSTCEVLDLVRNILEQAYSATSKVCSEKLLQTATKIVEAYSDLVPNFHKKLLETIPQQSALFYNNCMYLTHELLTNEQFYGSKSAKEGFSGDNFPFQVEHLQNAGSQAFMRVIESQRKQIEDILNDSDLAALPQIEKLDPKCNKSIRQCLRQLEVLKTVWQKVLSYEHYNKSIGDLLNSFVEHCIKLVLDSEDISANNCNVLVEIFQIVQNRGPTLFTDPNEVQLYTKRWNKFKELITLLNSNLPSIDDRWADGKGPLAHEFAAEDVRKLIKALFQNTDHRAAVLARIYK